MSKKKSLLAQIEELSHVAPKDIDPEDAYNAGDSISYVSHHRESYENDAAYTGLIALVDREEDRMREHAE